MKLISVARVVSHYQSGTRHELRFGKFSLHVLVGKLTFKGLPSASNLILRKYLNLESSSAVRL